MNQVIWISTLILFTAPQLSIAADSAEKNQQPVACTWEGVQQLCADIEKADQSGTPYSFGENGQLTSREKLEKQSETFEEDRAALTSKQKKKIKIAFDKTVVHAIESLRAGRSDEQLSPQEKNMIERIKTLQLSDLKSPTASFFCKEKTYVGVNPSEKELFVCPALADYPEAALVQAMGTYVGHYVGTCVGLFPIPKNKSETIPKIEGTHPFQAVQTCLASGELVPDPTKFTFDAKSKEPRDLEIKAKIERQIDRVANFVPAVKSYTPQRFFDEAIKPNMACSANITGSNMNSAANEWYGSDILARYMKAEGKVHPKTRQEQLEPLAYIVDDACRFTKIKNIAADNGHPPHQVRFRDVLFRNHRLRSVLGCKPEDFKQPACVMNQVGSGAETPAATPSSGAASGATQ